MPQDVSTEILMAFLDSAWSQAKDDANSLREQLSSNQSAALRFVSMGTMASVSKNSSSQSYEKYGAGSLTQVQIVESWSSLVGLYDAAVEKVTCAFSASGNPVPDGFDFDQPAYDLMRQVLAQGGVDTRVDLTNLNMPLAPQPSGVSW